MPDSVYHLRDYCFRPQDSYALSGSVTVARRGGIASLKLVQVAATYPGGPTWTYPTTGVHYVRTDAFAPTARLAWDIVEILGNTPTDENNVAVTSLSVRIHDGTNSLYWDGAAWSIAGSTNWNTLAVLQPNLAAYLGASLAIEVRLVTTNQLFTPTVRGVKLRWTGRPVLIEDELVFRTVRASLYANVRPRTRMTVSHAGGLTLDLDDTATDAGHDVQSVDAVYDHTADPTHLVDLRASYAVGTKIVTLTGDPGVTQLWLELRYRPQVAVTTAEDYSEGQKVPAIHITAIAWDEIRQSIGVRGPYIIDRTLVPARGTVFPQPIPLRNVTFTVEMLASSSTDLSRLAGAFNAWLESHPTLRMPALDQLLALQRLQRTEWATGPGQIRSLRRATSRFMLHRVPMLSQAGSGDATGDGSGIIGPITAGDLGFPDLGYAATTGNLTFSDGDGPGSETVLVEE
jgi:hypothetical protein